MRVMVIGGGGHLGSHLVPRLVSAGHEVAICDNMSGCPRIVAGKDVVLFTPNATDSNSSRPAFAKFAPEIVICALAHTYGRDFIYQFADDTGLVLESANVLSNLLTRSVKHVYFCSTSEVYGGPQTKRLLKETRKIDLSATHHGAAKLGAERLLAFRCQELGIGYTALRIFDMFGPREKFCARTSIVSFFIESFLRGDPLGFDGGTRLRDFIHVADVAATITALLGTDFSGTINVGTGRGTSLIQLVKALAARMDILEAPVLIPDGRIPVFSAVADVSVLDAVLPDRPPTLDVIGCLDQLIEFRKGGKSNV